MKYTEHTNELGITTIILDNGDGFISYIPTDPGNADYQAYLNKDNPVEHFTPNV
jgi:hypothetical protein